MVDIDLQGDDQRWEARGGDLLPSTRPKRYSATGALLLALLVAGFVGGGGLFLLVSYLGACAGSVVAGLALFAALRMRPA